MVRCSCKEIRAFRWLWCCWASKN